MAASERVKRIHDKYLVMDGLCGYAFPYEDILAGGINIAHVTLDTHYGMQSLLKEAQQYYAMTEMVPDKVLFVQQAEDMTRAKKEGKLGFFFGIQDSAPLEENTRVLPVTMYVLWKLGVRVMQPTYNDASLLGYGCTEPNDMGLTSFGRQVVQIMNRLGMVLDLSHTGNRTSREAIEASESPPIISHSNPWALKNSPRNKPDDLMKLVAERGGVMGVSPYAAFCKSKTGQRPTVEDFVDQVDYVVQLIGVDHVGIGTDKFEGRGEVDFYAGIKTRYSKLMVEFDDRHIVGLSNIRYWPILTEGLVKRGYSDEDCGKILGENFYNVFKKVWKKHTFC